MLDRMFNLPIVFVNAISQSFVTVGMAIFQLFSLIMNSPALRLFFISVAISFIFVVIKFIRSVVWGS